MINSARCESIGSVIFFMALKVHSLGFTALSEIRVAFLVISREDLDIGRSCAHHRLIIISLKSDAGLS